MNCAFSFLEAELLHSLLLSTAPLKQLLPPPDRIKDPNRVETQLKVIFGVFKCIMISPIPCAISTSGKKRSMLESCWCHKECLMPCNAAFCFTEKFLNLFCTEKLQMDTLNHTVRRKSLESRKMAFLRPNMRVLIQVVI